MRYLVGGDGPALVLCHGFISSGEEFGGRFATLAKNYTIIAPDLPGNGQSGPLSTRHTSAALAEAVSDLLDDLGISRFDVGGLCLGASVACALAERRGEAVERLILHTPLLAPRLLTARYRHQIRVLSLPPLWRMVVGLSRRRAVSDAYKRLVIGEKDTDAETADINFANQVRADPRAAREWLRDGCARDELALIARRTRPTLIIIPARDRLVDVEQLRRLAAGMPRVTLVVDGDGGHGWNAEAVERHRSQLESFLARSPAPQLS